MSHARVPEKDFSWWPWLLPMLMFALALRVGAGLLLPNIHQPDEIFQTLEPAHHLASGYGIVTWEWRAGIRSWFVPGLLAAVIASVNFLGFDASVYIGAIVVLLSGLSLSVVAVGFAVGARLFGRPGAILVGGLCAVWFEFVYFAPKSFSEVIAAHVLVIVAWLAQDTTRKRRFFLIGALLGLACMLRFQVAPMALVAALWLCRGGFRERWLPLLAGAAIPVLAQAVLDWAALGLPLQSIWLNFWINVVRERSATYGELPFYWYPGRLLLLWGPIMPPVVALSIIGARRLPLLGWMVLAHLIAHSLIAHRKCVFFIPPCRC
jgi:phosphatidylinositol glycan class B